MTTPPKPAPREWYLREWIDSQPDGFLSGKITENLSHDVYIERQTEDDIHVIEYTAYSAAMAAIELLREALDKMGTVHTPLCTSHKCYDQCLLKLKREALAKADKLLKGDGG